jgi:MFS family permease
MPEPTSHPRRPRLASGAVYPWLVVGLLWFCGFFNYADRQALSAVYPRLVTEFELTDWDLGVLGSAFMVVYALASPFAGYTVDRVARRLLIAVGLGFWSLICAATGLARSFVQLVLLRGAEGLGESFYFPASMSFLADYHGPRTRSRAMSIHQTSVYLGTAGGWYLGGRLAEAHGWRSPFWVLGWTGTAYALILVACLIEPIRKQTDPELAGGSGWDDGPAAAAGSASLAEKLRRIASHPAALVLLAVFIGANFVAATFLAWLPTFIFRYFQGGLSSSSATSTLWPMASLVGALCGGVMADRAARRSRSGRIRVQSLGLFLAAPFVLLAGMATEVWLLKAALIGAGLCKGIYDANIFAALYDVIPAEDRGTAAGLMNSVGWTGGFLAPMAVGAVSQWLSLRSAIMATSAVYLLVGLLALIAARLAVSRAKPLGPDGSLLPEDPAP